jgi:hypothetical protein
VGVPGTDPDIINPGFIEEEHNDPYNNFFQVKLSFSSKGTSTDNKYSKSSPQCLPSPSSGSYLPNPFSAHRFWKGLSRRRPPPDESVPQQRSRRKPFAHRARSDSTPEFPTNQPAPERKVREGKGKQGVNVNDVSAVSTLAHRSLNTTAVSTVLGMIHLAT